MLVLVGRVTAGGSLDPREKATVGWYNIVAWRQQGLALATTTIADERALAAV